MKYDIEELKKKGLIPETMKVAHSIYISKKGVTVSKEHIVLSKIQMTARKLKQQIKDITFDYEKTDEQIEKVDAWSARYVTTVSKKYPDEYQYPSDFLPQLEGQLDALDFTIDHFIDATDTMIDTVETIMNNEVQKKYFNDKGRPEIVIGIFAELYELLYDKKPTMGDKYYPSEFDEFVEDCCEQIGFQEQIRTYARKLAKNGWQTSGVVKSFVIPPLLDMKIVPDNQD
jgi:hypothetical protein